MLTLEKKKQAVSIHTRRSESADNQQIISYLMMEMTIEDKHGKFFFLFLGPSGKNNSPKKLKLSKHLQD